MIYRKAGRGAYTYSRQPFSTTRSWSGVAMQSLSYSESNYGSISQYWSLERMELRNV